MPGLCVQRLRTGFRTVAPSSPLLERRHARLDPFPPLTCDWPELFTFATLLGLGGTNTVVSRVFYGPVRITQITIYSSSNDPTLVRVHIGLDDDDDAPIADSNRQGNLVSDTGDILATTFPNFPTPSSPSAIHTGLVIRNGTFRFRVIATNTSGVVANPAGVVAFTHLRELTADT